MMDVSQISSIPSSGNIYQSNVKSAQAKDSSFEQKLVKAMDDKDDKQLKSACQEFESVIMNMMLKEMRATVQKSKLIPDDAGTDIFQSMLDEKYVEESSKNGGMGLGDMLYKQLSKTLKSAYKLE